MVSTEEEAPYMSMDLEVRKQCGFGFGQYGTEKSYNTRERKIKTPGSICADH